MKEKQTTKTKRVLNFISRSIKSRDRFATPISLNYDGDTEFKTTIGGSVSVALFLFLIVYSALLLKQMINRENRYCKAFFCIYVSTK